MQVHRKNYIMDLCITRRIGLQGFFVLTQSSIYKEYLDLMDTEAWKQYIKLKIYKLQQIVFQKLLVTIAACDLKVGRCI